MSVAIFRKTAKDSVMLQIWIVSFILGVLVARMPLSPSVRDGLIAWADWPALALAVGLAALFEVLLGQSRVARIHRVVAGLAGALWGLGHAAPFPELEGTFDTTAQVVKVASRDSASGPALVRVGADVYEVLGLQQPGALGTLVVMPAERLFGTTRGVFRASDRQRSTENSDDFLGRARAAVRAVAAERSKALTPFYRSWLAGLVMGERAALPVDVRDAFKRTGLYHLLVVSGLHVTLMALVLAALIRAPAHLAYSLRLIGPATWRHTGAALQVLAGCAALLYLAVTGSPAAAQRAALLFVVVTLASVFYGMPRSIDRLQLAAAAQILIFPVGFVGEATLMSWVAYVLVLKGEGSGVEARGWRSLCRRLLPLALRMQIGLTALVAAVFGQLALVGLVANLVLIPAFPVLLMTGLLALALPELPILPMLLAIQRSFIALVRLFDGLCDVVPWLSIPADDLPTAARLVCLGISAWILLNTSRELTIRT